MLHQEDFEVIVSKALPPAISMSMLIAPFCSHNAYRMLLSVAGVSPSYIYSKKTNPARTHASVWIARQNEIHL